MSDWEKAQAWENDWWGDCVNTLNEEKKQIVYAERMSITTIPDAKTPYNYSVEGADIIDIGGGPVSLLLKCFDRGNCLVVDPLKLPDWVFERYMVSGIRVASIKGEEISPKLGKFDEAWIYNCLQHTENPEQVIKNAKQVSKLIRIFEWIDTPPNEGHPHTLTEESLNKWLGGEGQVEDMSSTPLKGKAYYGVFI